MPNLIGSGKNTAACDVINQVAKKKKTTSQKVLLEKRITKHTNILQKQRGSETNNLTSVSVIMSGDVCNLTKDETALK